MGIIVLYLGMVVVGYPIGAMLRKKNIEFKGVNAVEMVTIAFLVFMMGARIGANDEVIRSLDTIGLEAFVLVVLVVRHRERAAETVEHLQFLAILGILLGNLLREKFTHRGLQAYTDGLES